VFYAVFDLDTYVFDPREPRGFKRHLTSYFRTVQNSRTSVPHPLVPNPLLFRLSRNVGLLSNWEKRSALAVDRRQSVGPCLGDPIRMPYIVFYCSRIKLHEGVSLFLQTASTIIRPGMHNG
jgi:hypothetical protein